MKRLIAMAATLALAASNGWAVILAGGDGTQNTTAPSGGQGWDYVGRITSANGAPSSVTYIDNNWFITAHHIKELDNPTGVLLGSSSYSIDPNSWTRLTNSTGTDADLEMFRVTSDVGLPALTVASSTPANGSGITMIGNGRNRETSETWWDSDWNETTSTSHTYAGYKWATGATKRWGTNNKEANAGLKDDGYGETDMFYSDFDAGTSDAQGATYDSGGGVFYDTGSEWELAGIMLVTTQESGQPASTSVYGNRTYMANISTYSGQIADTVAIPEPSALMLGLLVPASAFFVRRTFMS